MGIVNFFSLLRGQAFNGYDAKRASDHVIFLVDCNSILYNLFSQHEYHGDTQCGAGETYFLLAKAYLDRILEYHFGGIETRTYEIVLFIDNAEKRPKNKVCRPRNLEVSKKFKCLVEYLTGCPEPAGKYYFDCATHCLYGESDIQIYQYVEGDREDPVEECEVIIITNDSDMLAFDYVHRNISIYFANKNLLVEQKGFSRRNTLGHLSIPFLTACISGCDYGSMVRNCKCVGHLGGPMAQFKRYLRLDTPSRKLLLDENIFESLYDKFTSPLKTVMEKFNLPSDIARSEMVWCSRDPAKLTAYLKYITNVYYYFFYGQPFDISAEYYKSDICCEEALNVLVLFNAHWPMGDPYLMTKEYILQLGARPPQLLAKLTTEKWISSPDPITSASPIHEVDPTCKSTSGRQVVDVGALKMLASDYRGRRTRDAPYMLRCEISIRPRAKLLDKE